MISGGTIGGGQELAPPPPTTPAPAAGQFEGGGLALPMLAGGPSQGTWDAMFKDFSINDYLSNSMWANGISQVIGTLGNVLAMGIQFEAMVDINNRRAQAAEHISDNQVTLGQKYLDIANKSDERLNGPGGLNRHIVNTDAALKDRMDERKVSAWKEIEATRMSDSRFELGGGVPRNDYPYGLPS